MSALLESSFRLRSFVPRNGRKTPGQKRALLNEWPKLAIDITQQPVNLNAHFERVAPLVLEIGFGTGQSLLAAAQMFPEINFIGIETYEPGIGALCMGITELQLTNCRIMKGDAVDIVNDCLLDDSLDGVQLFFPDPWPKRRHHPRRLIQTAFVELLLRKLKPNGALHLATDWEDYAIHMMRVLSTIDHLENLAGKEQYAMRSAYRPIESKFERRALREGRVIRDLQFKKHVR